MSIITLLTDFGLADEYVGVVKGVILSINPSATIVDITHQVDPQDLVQAAYIIKASCSFFPEHTIHVIVVDPGVGSQRDIIALKRNGQVFIAPDNGVIGSVLDDGVLDCAVRVERSVYWAESVSRTFHGRDIFAPVAAHLSKGLDIRQLGSAVNPEDLVRLPIPGPYVTQDGELVGHIISIDRFGNLITDIDRNYLEKLCKSAQYDHIDIHIGTSKISGVSQSYCDVGAGAPLSLIGSRGCLELAVNCGSAARFFHAVKKDLVRIRIPVPFVGSADGFPG